MIDTTPKIFHAVVSSSDPGSYSIQVEPIGGEKTLNMMQGIPLASVFASTLGFRECILPPIGAVVVCLYVSTNTCYILGIKPNEDTAGFPWPSRTSLKTGGDGNGDEQNTVGYTSEISKVATHNNNRPTDITENELGWANEFGVALGAIQQMAYLKASELAQVQCFLLDDLVRIVSHNFEHFNAMGEVKIWHDGKSLLYEAGATHLPNEALGQPEVESSAAGVTFTESGKNTPDDADNFYKIEEDERIMGIERLKLFVGRLADFLHLYVVRPAPDEPRIMNGEAPETPDRGMMDLHVGLDGSVHIRSVTEIFMEKVSWIRVPQRIRKPDDSKGDDAERIEYDEKPEFKFSDDYKVRGNPIAYALQIRDYNAFLQEKYNYLNFDKHEKDFAVNKDQSKETPLEQVSKVDPNTPVGFKNYTLRTSGIYLMKNGGITIRDGFGSAIVMEGGDISFQAAKDEIHQPMRHMVAKVGHSLQLSAKKHLDFTSTEEGLRIKTEKAQHYYSDKQGIVIHSNAENIIEADTEGAAVQRVGGIVLKATKGIAMYAEDMLTRITGSSIQHVNKLQVHADEEINLSAEQNAYLLAKGSVFAIAQTGSMFAVGGGTGIFAGNTTVLGKKDANLGVIYDDGNPFVDVIKGAVDVEEITNLVDTLSRKFQEEAAFYREDDKFTDLKFYFLKSEDFGLEDKIDFIPQTNAQQEEEITGVHKLSDWTEVEVEGTKPFPGQELWSSYYIMSAIGNLKDNNGDLGSKPVEELQDKATLTSASLNSYKVKK